MMKTNVKVVFKDNQERVFDANKFIFQNYRFCDIQREEENERRLVACVAMDEIKYLMFVEVE